MHKIAIISSSMDTFMGFRWNLINTLMNKGCSVYLLAPVGESKNVEILTKIGAVVVDVKITRTGMNPFLDIYSIVNIYNQLLKIKPDIVLTSLIKAVIYGSLAAWLAKVPKKFAMIEGLGYVFTYPLSELKYSIRILRWVVVKLYKLAFSFVDDVFFLNPDDQAEFIDLGLVKISNSKCIGGIGVDLKKWAYTPATNDHPRFLMIARLLREKGIYEYVEAAKLVKKKYPDTQFTLLGGWDENPGAITIKEVEGWVEQGVLEWHGHVPVADFLSKCSVYVLPSYREGLPVSTMEAMAIGRAVITTDVPGCRETVLNGINGFIVPAKDVIGLASRMIWFIENKSTVSGMGAASRKIAEEKFDVHKINVKLIKLLHLDEY